MTPWTVAHQSPLSLVFPRQEYWSDLPFSSPGQLPAPGIKPKSPCLGRQLLYHWVTWEAHTVYNRTVFSDFFTLRHLLICSMSSKDRVKSSAFKHSAASWEPDKNWSSGLWGQSESRRLGLGTKGTSKKWAQTSHAPFYLNIFASS